MNPSYSGSEFSFYDSRYYILSPVNKQTFSTVISYKAKILSKVSATISTIQFQPNQNWFDETKKLSHPLTLLKVYCSLSKLFDQSLHMQTRCNLKNEKVNVSTLQFILLGLCSSVSLVKILIKPIILVNLKIFSYLKRSSSFNLISQHLTIMDFLKSVFHHHY